MSKGRLSKLYPEHFSDMLVVDKLRIVISCDRSYFPFTMSEQLYDGFRDFLWILSLLHFTGKDLTRVSLYDCKYYGPTFRTNNRVISMSPNVDPSASVGLSCILTLSGISVLLPQPTYLFRCFNWCRQCV